MIAAQEAKDRAALANEFGPGFPLALDNVAHMIKYVSSQGDSKIHLRYDRGHDLDKDDLPKLHKYFERTQFQTDLNIDSTELIVYW